MKCILITLLRTVTILVAIFVISTVLFVGGHDSGDLKSVNWKFSGMFGKVDKPAAQRGFQIYKEVCSTCHALKQVAYRNLAEIGFSADEIKSIAGEYEVLNDTPNDDGEFEMRKAKPSDRFVSPYPNDKAAAAALGAAPPDLSLIIKARHDGANYVYSLMQGFKDAPECIKTEEHDNLYKAIYHYFYPVEEDTSCKKLAEGMNYNEYFPGKQIAMPQPLSNDSVEYQDGTTATLEQESRDVVTFLQWVAEPEMELRNQIGIAVLVFLLIFTILFWRAKKKIWKSVK